MHAAIGLKIDACMHLVRFSCVLIGNNTTLWQNKLVVITHHHHHVFDICHSKLIITRLKMITVVDKQFYALRIELKV